MKVMTDKPNPMFLGKDSPLPQNPEEAVLDYVPNPRANFVPNPLCRT
jgi:hypothetical protein